MENRRTLENMMPQRSYSENAATIDFLGSFASLSKVASNPDAIAALLVDPEFVMLEQAITAFNPFYAMGLGQREVPHSNFLACLFSPLEGHGLGISFLTALFPAFEDSRPQDIVVLREYSLSTRRRLDVLVYDQRRRVAGIVEAKVNSKEGELQRRDYREWAQSHFIEDDWQLGLIYLTNNSRTLPEAFRPCPFRLRDALATPVEWSEAHEDEVWHPLSFEVLSEALAALIDPTALDGPAGCASDTIRQYVSFIGLHICPTQGCYASIASDLSKRHRTALAALIEARASFRGEALDALSDDFAALGLRVTSVTRDGCCFGPIDDADWSLPDRNNRLAFSLNLWGGSPAFMIEVANTSADDSRQAREWFNYGGRGAGARRVVSHSLALPSPLSPFPLALHNRDIFVEHMRTVVRRFGRDHVIPGMDRMGAARGGRKTPATA
jgi:hypothetical protein